MLTKVFASKPPALLFLQCSKQCSVRIQVFYRYLALKITYFSMNWRSNIYKLAFEKLIISSVWIALSVTTRFCVPLNMSINSMCHRFLCNNRSYYIKQWRTLVKLYFLKVAVRTNLSKGVSLSIWIKSMCYGNNFSAHLYRRCSECLYIG